MDKLVTKIVALGVPGLILVVAMGVSGWAGGAAITVALAGGPFGMLGGICTPGSYGPYFRWHFEVWDGEAYQGYNLWVQTKGHDN
ncbi:MAG: hypothetical protein Q8S19_02620 [Bacillota bacterium]|nr:hypothetical protein [Bacillota bacterium]